MRRERITCSDGTHLHDASSFGKVLSQLFSANICSRSMSSPNSPGRLGGEGEGGMNDKEIFTHSWYEKVDRVRAYIHELTHPLCVHFVSRMTLRQGWKRTHVVHRGTIRKIIFLRSTRPSSYMVVHFYAPHATLMMSASFFRGRRSSLT